MNHSLPVPVALTINQCKPAPPVRTSLSDLSVSPHSLEQPLPVAVRYCPELANHASIVRQEEMAEPVLRPPRFLHRQQLFRSVGQAAHAIPHLDRSTFPLQPKNAVGGTSPPSIGVLVISFSISCIAMWLAPRERRVRFESRCLLVPGLSSSKCRPAGYHQPRVRLEPQRCPRGWDPIPPPCSAPQSAGG